MGISWLCTYISIRPGELRCIVEEAIDLDRGILMIRDHKTRKHRGPKLVPLLGADIEFIRSLPRGFPQWPFFRMDVTSGSRPAGSPFGQKMFRKWWDRACKNLGIVGVDLNGGARHSTHQYLRQCGKTPEVILHHQNKNAELLKSAFLFMFRGRGERI
jgi:hypothetical protein